MLQIVMLQACQRDTGVQSKALSSAAVPVTLNRQHSVLLMASDGTKATRGLYPGFLAEQIRNSDGETDVNSMHTKAAREVTRKLEINQQPKLMSKLDKFLIIPPAKKQ